MFEHFIPLAGREAYRASPHKDRMDLLTQHLVSQRYRPAVIGQHLREWLRFSTDLVTHQLAVPPHRSAPVVQAYLARRLARCGTASWARVIRASIRIFLEADAQGHYRRRVSTHTIHVVSPWMQVAIDGYLTFLRAHRGLAARTLEKRAWQLTQFAQGIEAMGLTRIDAIAPVHLQQFMAQRDQLAVATRRSGMEPLWRRDGAELFFRNLRGDLFAVPVTTGATFKHGVPKLLFSRPGLTIQDFYRNYDVSPDGKRFLMLDGGGGETSALNVIFNWGRQLERVAKGVK